MLDQMARVIYGSAWQGAVRHRAGQAAAMQGDGGAAVSGMSYEGLRPFLTAGMGDLALAEPRYSSHRYFWRSLGLGPCESVTTVVHLIYSLVLWC